MAKDAERGEKTRQRILDAARTVAAERGFKGTTLAMIQREAGVHPGSLYWFFEDKDALFAALVESSAAHSIGSAAAGAVGDAVNPVRSVLSSIVDNPARYGLWRFNVQLMLDPDMATSKTAAVIRQLRVNSQRAMTASWVDLLPEEVVAAQPDLAQQLAEYALACAEGCILARVAHRPVDEDALTTTVTRTLDRMVDLACHGAGVPTPPVIADRIAALYRRENEHGLAR